MFCLLDPRFRPDCGWPTTQITDESKTYSRTVVNTVQNCDKQGILRGEKAKDIKEVRELTESGRGRKETSRELRTVLGPEMTLPRFH